MKYVCGTVINDCVDWFSYIYTRNKSTWEGGCLNLIDEETPAQTVPK